MDLNREELAWAAGFFDGEGHTSVVEGNRDLRLTVSQVGRECLERFQAAVGGLGKIYGPYLSPSKKRNFPNSQPQFCYLATGEKAHAIIFMLWVFLSGPKRQQASDAVLAYRAVHATGTKAERNHRKMLKAWETRKARASA